MMKLDCRNLCQVPETSTIVSPPCFVCDDGSFAPIPPTAPVVVFGEEPDPTSVTPSGDFLTGTGINASGASVATDSAIELFLAPLIAGVAGSEAMPDGDGDYMISLAPGQALAMVFGVTLVSGVNVKITDFYNVTFDVEAGGDNVSFALVPSDTAPSGYAWNGPNDYIITDSQGNAAGLSVQNVTRLTYLVDAGLPPEAVDPGVSVWTMTAIRNGSGQTTTLTVIVTTE